MIDWWWWMSAVVVVTVAWRWHRESEGGSWWRMTGDKWLMLAVLAMAACLCWRKETGSAVADGAMSVAMVAALVSGVVVVRRRRREAVEKHRRANDT